MNSQCAYYLIKNAVRVRPIVILIVLQIIIMGVGDFVAMGL